MPYDEVRFGKHEHRWHVDADTNELVCLCGSVKGKTKEPEKKANKYNARRTEYNGRTYDSAFEAEVAQELDWRMKAGELTEIIPQYPLEIRIEGRLIKRHKVDFLAIRKDGGKELVEAKGVVTAEYRLIRDLIELVYLPQNPDTSYTVVKQTQRRPKRKWS